MRLRFLFNAVILPLILIAGILVALYYFFPDVVPNPLRQPEPSVPVSRVVARVVAAGLPPLDITEADVLQQKAFMSVATGNSPASNEQALQAIVRNHMLYQEAVGRRVAFSREEAAAMARTQEKMYRAGVLPEASQVEALMAAVGVDADTYWQKIAPERYQHVMSQFQLRQAVLRELAPRIPPGNRVKVDKLYDKWVESVMARAGVQIIDRAFIEAREPEQMP